MNQGDRLACSNGIIGLSAFAAILLVAFEGDTNALIPLYMIGVFISFTLSQAALSRDVRAVYVNVDPASTEQLRQDWEKWGQGVPLVVLESPYRSLMEPLLEYIGRIDSERPDDYVTVVIPEFIPARWWHHLFHNQRALLIKGALLFKPNTIVTSVPFHFTR